MKELRELTNDVRNELMLFVIPSFTLLSVVLDIANKYGICPEAQNMCWEVLDTCW